MAKADKTVQDQLGAAGPFSRVRKRVLRSLASAAKGVDHQAGHQVVEEGGEPHWDSTSSPRARPSSRWPAPSGAAWDREIPSGSSR